jgi:ABC-type Mn2+/Zn2+ transport system permease subunit
MGVLLEIFDPQFLSRNSVYISLLIGFVCPLVGVYLVLRRVVFLGVALPQVSSCGIAFAFAMQGWGWIPHAHDSAEERAIALGGSVLFTLAAILLLSIMERRGRGLIEGRTGTAFVLAGAWSILLLVQNPLGEHGMLELLRGEIIAVSNTDLTLTGGTFALVILGLTLFQKEFLLVSFDREMAVTLKKRVIVWDTLLFTLIGLTISVSVLSVGPLVAFGFLLLPPLIAYQFAQTMRQFAIAASVIGGVTAVLGFCIAYRRDLPVGPTDVALLGVLYAIAFGARKMHPRGRAPGATAVQPQASPAKPG